MPTDQTPPPDEDQPSGPNPETPVGSAETEHESSPEMPTKQASEAYEEYFEDEPPLAYDGKSGQLFKMGLMVTLLTALTGGIYAFWGKTRIRHYLWGHLTLLGDRISYTGTGRELFLGFLIVLAVLAPVALVFGGVEYLLAGSSVILQVAFGAAQYVFYTFLIGFAIYRSRRYRLSRTLWRGIRFGQTGSATNYAIRVTMWSLAIILTLGLIIPVYSIRLTQFEISNTWLGNRHFTFHGKARDLYKTWILCWLALPFTLGLSYSWFTIYLAGYTISRTRFEGLSFDMPIRLRDARSILIAIFSLNLAFILAFGVLIGMAVYGAQTVPLFVQIAVGVLFLCLFLFGRALSLRFVMHPYLALIADRIEMNGTAEFDAIIQNMETRPATGEGLASALDVGAGLDAGF